MDGDPAVEVQRVVEEPERTLVPSAHSPGHAKRAARRHGPGAAPVHAKARTVARRHREDPEERVTLVEEQHLARDVDLDARRTTTGDERARRAGCGGGQQHLVGGPAGAGEAVHLLERHNRVRRVVVEHTIDRAHVVALGVEPLLEVEHDLTARTGPKSGQGLGLRLGRGHRRRRGDDGAALAPGLCRGLPAAGARAGENGRQHRDRQPAIVSGCLGHACLQGTEQYERVDGRGRVSRKGVDRAVQLR